jgi:hypothetical protein
LTRLAPLLVLAALAACTANPAPGGPSAPSSAGEPTMSPSPATARPVAPTPGLVRCVTSGLTVGVVDGPNAAGHIGLVIVFKNVTSSPCTMSGYPGISFVTGPSGTQVGDAAARASAAGNPVSVRPRGQAHAALLLGQVANYPAGSCRPTRAAGIRVYPPGETTALYVASAREVCAGTGLGFAEVYPIDAGAGP